jgi:phosphopantothenoylcysteine synthetase/decarboxylase
MDSEKQLVDRLLVGVSGSIAILSLPSYLVSLRATLAREVKVIMTPTAAKLLPPSTVSLLCDGVFLDWSPVLEKRPGHMELARWSDMFVVLPASANVLGQAANGLATNLLTTTILASPRPVVFFPNLTDEMWSKNAVQRNVRTLREDGHVVIEPELAIAFEIDSGEMRESWIIPQPEQLIERLLQIYESSESDFPTDQ